MTTAASLDAALAVSMVDNKRLPIAFTRADIDLLTRLLAQRLRTERLPVERQVLTHLLGTFREGRPTVRHTFVLTDTLVGYLVDTLTWYGPSYHMLQHELRSLRR